MVAREQAIPEATVAGAIKVLDAPHPWPRPRLYVALGAANVAPRITQKAPR